MCDCMERRAKVFKGPWSCVVAFCWFEVGCVSVFSPVFIPNQPYQIWTLLKDGAQQSPKETFLWLLQRGAGPPEVVTWTMSFLPLAQTDSIFFVSSLSAMNFMSVDFPEPGFPEIQNIPPSLCSSQRRNLVASVTVLEGSKIQENVSLWASVIRLCRSGWRLKRRLFTRLWSRAMLILRMWKVDNCFPRACISESEKLLASFDWFDCIMRLNSSSVVWISTNFPFWWRWSLLASLLNADSSFPWTLR